MSAAQRIVEFTEARGSQPVGIDRTNGILRGVKILGRESANGRQYPEKTLTAAAHLYEGKGVNLDHSKATNRSVRDRFGVLKNVQAKPDGLYADWHFNPKHAFAEDVFWAAESHPHLMGFSHSVDIKSRRSSGTSVVEEITNVYSVDLVADPATTKGLFESMSNTKPKKLGDILEQSVLEMLGDDAAALEIDVPDAGSPDEEIKAAFRKLVVAAFDDDKLDTKATAARIKKVLTAYEKTLKITGETADAPDADGDKTMTAETESLKNELARAKGESRVLEQRLKVLEEKEKVTEQTKVIRRICTERGRSLDEQPEEVTEALLSAFERGGEEKAKRLAEQLFHDSPRSRDQHAARHPSEINGGAVDLVKEGRSEGEKYRDEQLKQRGLLKAS